MKLPEGPKAPPFIQSIQWIADPVAYLNKCAERYGEIFTVQIGNYRLIVVSNPQAIQEIFTADPKLFESGVANGILKPLLGEQSLILQDGDRHQRKRKLLIPPFHGDRMRSYGKIICDAALAAADKWVQGAPFLVRGTMQEITMQVILNAVFGIGEGARYEELKKLLGLVLEATASPLRASMLFFESLQRDWGAWSPWGKFLRWRQRIDELIYAEIRERRREMDLPASVERTDILSLLMAARDEDGQPMTDIELRDELITLLSAGHETTASALSWAFYWLHQLPEVRAKLLQELDDLGDHPDPNTIAQLPYLSAFCQETLRIYPIAFLTIPRLPKVPFKLMGYEFAPGTMLAPCIYLAHRRSELYPNPEQFRPERFLERQFSPYEFLTFGGGNRRCIGMAFAMFEMKLVLATILSQFELSLADSHPLKPVRRGLTLAPPANMSLVLTGQRKAAPIPVNL